MFKIECEKALPSKCRTRYRGIAYDGCSFYLTVYGANRIVQMNADFKQTQFFDTCRCYTALCYDPAEHCFWASANNCLPTIYRLNECFEEIECIPIRCEGGGAVTTISQSCCKGVLVVSFPSLIIHLDTKHPNACTAVMSDLRACIRGALSVCPYTFCLYTSARKQEIRIYSDFGELLREMEVPPEYKFESAVLVPCADDCGRCHFAVLASKPGGYPYVLNCVMTYGTLHDRICECNYKICCQKCHCEAQRKRDCKESCCEILESIALVETSIAHILNAEGEKLQKAIASTDDLCKLIEVNDSVRKTIEKATHLEYTLYDKIDALRDWCDICEDDRGGGRSCGECQRDCHCVQ